MNNSWSMHHESLEATLKRVANHQATLELVVHTLAVVDQIETTAEGEVSGAFIQPMM